MDKLSHNNFSAFADKAALLERKSNMSVLREGTKQIEFNWQYEPEIRRKNSLKLIDNVTLLVDHSKEQWNRQKNNEIVNIYDFDKRIINYRDFDESINSIQKTALKIDCFAHSFSEQIHRPVILIFNARTATIYSLIYKKLWERQQTRDSVYKWYSENLQKIKCGFEKSAVYVITDVKISSKKYVQSVEEAKMLAGYENINRLRTSYSYVDNEFIPLDFIDVLKGKMSLVFIDVPSWGSAYASSTGLIRKQSDMDQRKKGIYNPYKMRSYLEYLEYQIYAISNSKMKTDIVISEENNAGFDFSKPIGVIVNPETETNIWWDNCPQLLGEYGRKFEEVVHSDLHRPVYVLTNHGELDLFSYIKKRIGLI